MSEPTPMPTYWALAEEVTHLHGQLDKLKAENAKLRELTDLLLLGVDNDMPRDEKLVWSQKVNTLTRELGVEVDE